MHSLFSFCLALSLIQHVTILYTRSSSQNTERANIPRTQPSQLAQLVSCTTSGVSHEVIQVLHHVKANGPGNQHNNTFIRYRKKKKKKTQQQYQQQHQHINKNKIQRIRRQKLRRKPQKNHKEQQMLSWTCMYIHCRK